MYRTFAIATLLIIAACTTGPRYEIGTVDSAALAAEIELQGEELRGVLLRLGTTFAPLVANGVPLCADVAPYYGFSWSDEPGERRVVRYVDFDSPAEIGGLMLGDRIDMIDGERVATREEIQRERSRLRPGMTYRPRRPIDMALNDDTPKEFQVTRNVSSVVMLTLRPEMQCAYDAMLVDADAVTAYADGRNVYVTRGMMEFVQSDAELQFVLAHELAHNAARHIDAVRQNASTGAIIGAVIGAVADAALGTRTGMRAGAASGTQAGLVAYSQDFEREADYLAAYFLARAGVDMTGLEEFWRRLGAGSGYQSLRPDANSSHPSYPERVVRLRATIREINTKIANGEPLLPAMRLRE